MKIKMYKSIKCRRMEIKENNWDLSLSKYKEHVYEEEVYREPKEILEEIGKTHSELSNDIKELKKLV